LGLSDGLTDEGSQEPLLGSTYYVDFTIAKEESDYEPVYYFSPKKIREDWGDAIADYPISLASQISYENGAMYWLIAPLNPNDGSEYEQFSAALDRVKAKECNVVVPMTTNENIFSLVKAHVENMSTQLERKWRTAFLGLSGDHTVEQMKTLATGLNSRRIVLVYPENVSRSIGSSTVDLNGAYLAAALGGIRVNPNYDVATPLTRRNVSGFSSISGNITLRVEKNEIAAAGVTIVDFDGVNAVVRHGKTTAIDTVINQEISLTDITDYVAEVTYRVLENAYVGKKITVDTPLNIVSTTDGILQQLIQNEIIVDAINISAEQNESDPTQIDVSFEISPVYPLNYINITFTITV